MLAFHHIVNIDITCLSYKVEPSRGLKIEVTPDANLVPFRLSAS